MAYCRAAAEFVIGTAEPPFFFTPINEITFFSAAATDLEWMYPFAKGREKELKRALARMAIAAAKAIREVCPEARMVHVDPIVHAVPPPDRPDLAEQASDEEHRQALVRAAVSGSEKFFLGTDSAPHPKNLKEHSCGCAGCYTALHAVELYAQAFEQAGALDKPEAFASIHGPAFYDLPRNTDTVTLKREPWTVPAELAFGETAIVPLNGGEIIEWKLV